MRDEGKHSETSVVVLAAVPSTVMLMAHGPHWLSSCCHTPLQRKCTWLTGRWQPCSALPKVSIILHRLAAVLARTAKSCLLLCMQHSHAASSSGLQAAYWHTNAIQPLQTQLQATAVLMALLLSKTDLQTVVFHHPDNTVCLIMYSFGPGTTLMSVQCVAGRARQVHQGYRQSTRE